MLAGGGGDGEGGKNRWSTGRFQGDEAILYDTVTVDTRREAFVQLTERYNTESKSQCRLRASVHNNVSLLVHQL